MQAAASRDSAAEVLRRWALNEDLKQAVMASPAMAAIATRVSRRYTAGETIDDAIAAAKRSLARGHAVSVEYVGESVRDESVAGAATDVFLELIDRLGSEGIPGTVSFDLSHVGAVVDPALGLRNARRMASALEPLGSVLMISAEGSDRTDLVLDTYDRLHEHHPNVGVTVQARLHRSASDLDRLLAMPGRIRLVKGAFAEPEAVAYSRGSIELRRAYLTMAEALITSGHPTSIATHDDDLINALVAAVPSVHTATNVEFEMLLGLGTATLDRLQVEGYRTREYSIFGDEWWLYVLNRIAEQPDRVFDAILDIGSE